MKTLVKTLLMNKLMSVLVFSAATLVTFVACARKPGSEGELSSGSLRDNSAQSKNINI